MCWGRIWGPCGLDLKSQSLVIESFSVGSRAVLSTMGKVLAAAGSKSFMALVSRSQRKQHVWRNLLRLHLFSAANMHFFCLTAFSASNTRFFHLMYFPHRGWFFSPQAFHVSKKNVSVFQNLTDSLRTDQNNLIFRNLHQKLSVKFKFSFLIKV